MVEGVQTGLKPCPFCGGEAVRMLDDFEDEYKMISLPGYAVHCRHCKASTEWFDRVEDAINAWNERPEREHGRWKPDPDADSGVFWCSECDEPFQLMDGTPEENNYHFCPCCGADMREEVKES